MRMTCPPMTSRAARLETAPTRRRARARPGEAHRCCPAAARCRRRWPLAGRFHGLLRSLGPRRAAAASKTTAAASKSAAAETSANEPAPATGSLLAGTATAWHQRDVDRRRRPGAASHAHLELVSRRSHAHARPGGRG